ncbi:aldo/keto reductase [Akkermansiaceae bacterium]|nr:aldo/keto reductase [Akkermansiaceae bacterium]
MSAHLLPDGSAFPSPGLGTWKLPEERTPEIIHHAIELGYRHLDCAADYGNEELVGKGITSALAAGLCEREDLWVTSKLWNTDHEPPHVRAACERSLKDLGLEYLDLYLAVAQSPPKEAHQTVFNHIARHPVHRQRMDVCNPGAGKPAITDLHLLHSAPDGTSLILCALHTGRTHQIRVHNRYMGHPLLADPIYSKPARQVFKSPRLMLHAWRLGFTHPATGQWVQNEAPIPEEFHRWSDEVSERLEQVRAIKDSKEYDALW